MRKTFPDGLPEEKVNVLLLYAGRGEWDRNVSLDRVLQERSPVAVLDLATMIQTDLASGRRNKVGRSWRNGEGRWNYTIEAWPDDRYHALGFNGPGSLQEYLKSHHS